MESPDQGSACHLVRRAGDTSSLSPCVTRAATCQTRARGLRICLRPGVRPRRRLHRRDEHRRPAGQRSRRPRAGPCVRRRGRPRRRVPRAQPDRLLVEDLLLQEVVLDAVEAAIEDLARASADLDVMIVVGAPLRTATGSTTPRSSSTAVGSSGSRRSPTCRPTASSTSAATSRPATTAAASDPGRRARGAVRPDLLFRGRRRARAGPARRGLRGHVGAGAAERGGRPRRRDRPGQHLRQPDHRRPRRGPQAAVPLGVVAVPGRLRLHRGGAGESTTDLSWDGQTMVYEGGELLAETDRFPDGRSGRSPTSTSTCAAPGAQRQGTFDDNRRTLAESGRTTFRTVEVTLDGARRGHRGCAGSGPLPVRAGRPAAPRARLLRGLQHPGRRAWSSGCARSATPTSSSASAAASTRRTR